MEDLDAGGARFSRDYPPALLILLEATALFSRRVSGAIIHFGTRAIGVATRLTPCSA
jgi:hypothetical protein